MNNSEALQCFHAYLRRRFPDRRTPVDYLSDVRQLQQACDKPWDSVTMQDIDSFVTQMHQAGLKPTTINRRVAALKVYFDVLAEECDQLSHRNPVRPKRHAAKLGQRLPRDLSDAEVSRLWAILRTTRDRAVVALLLHAGLRVSEAIAVTCDALTDALTPGPAPAAPTRLRVLGKGQKERIALLNQEALSALAAWQAERPAVDTPQFVLNERGRPLTVSGVEWLLTGYGAQIGVHLTPHRLRHTFARRLTEARMPIESLARLMGHAQISTTQIYLAGADPNLRETFAQAMQAIQATASSAGDHPAPTAAAQPSLPDATPRPLIEPSYPAPDDGSTWALDLPAAIRTDCLAYVQRHASAWRPSQRRACTQNALNELARFFRFVCAQRPLTQVSDLSRADLQGYVDSLGARGLKAEAIRRPVNRILGLLRELEEHGVALAPALFRISRPKKPESLPRAVSEQEMQCLEALARSWLAEPTAASARLAACFFVLAHTGLRACELLDLRQADVDVAQRRVCVRAGKGMRDRVVYLTDIAVDALHHYRLLCPHPQSALLLVGDHGQPLTWSWLYIQMRRMGEAVAVSGLTPHRLRHTFATRLINAGVPITSIQKLLGHDHLSTTQIYARVYDTTVEHDYRRAMAQMEHVPPLTLPVELFQPKAAVCHNQARVKVLDNSV